MASTSEVNLRCTICHELFQEPVLLGCSHSFCKACLQRWWTQKTNLECPLCRGRSLQRDPPLNLALKIQCEAFIQERCPARAAALCNLSSESLFRIAGVDHPPPLSARNYKQILQQVLKPSQEKLELLNDVKGNFDQTAKDIELQAQDTEREIKDVFSMLQKILRKEEKARIAAVRQEQEKKSRTMKRKSEALDRKIKALSDTVRATEELLRGEDLSVLLNYENKVKRAQQALPEVPPPIQGGMIDTDKHLNKLHYKVLHHMKKEVRTALKQRRADPQPAAVLLGRSLSRMRVRH